MFPHQLLASYIGLKQTSFTHLSPTEQVSTNLDDLKFQVSRLEVKFSEINGYNMPCRTKNKNYTNKQIQENKWLVFKLSNLIKGRGVV